MFCIVVTGSSAGNELFALILGTYSLYEWMDIREEMSKLWSSDEIILVGPEARAAPLPPPALCGGRYFS